MKRWALIAKLAWKMARWEIRRWENQRVVRCMDCDPTGGLLHPSRLRTPIAHQFAEAHAASYDHFVTVRRG